MKGININILTDPKLNPSNETLDINKGVMNTPFHKASTKTLKFTAQFTRDALDNIDENPGVESYMIKASLERLALIESIIKEREKKSVISSR